MIIKLFFTLCFSSFPNNTHMDLGGVADDKWAFIHIDDQMIDDLGTGVFVNKRNERTAARHRTLEKQKFDSLQVWQITDLRRHKFTVPYSSFIFIYRSHKREGTKIMELPENPNKKIGELFTEGFKGLDKVNNCTEATNSSTVQACYKTMY